MRDGRKVFWLAEFRIRVTLDPTSAVDGLGKVERSLKSASTAAERFRKRITGALGGAQTRNREAAQSINQSHNTIQIALRDTTASAELANRAIGRGATGAARQTQAAAQRIRGSLAQLGATVRGPTTEIRSAFGRIAASLTRTQTRLQRLGGAFSRFRSRAVGAMRRVSTQARLTQQSVSSLGSVFRRGFAFVGISAATFGFVRLADQADQVANRLRILSTDNENLNAQMQALFDIARATRAPFEAVSEVYARFAFNTQNLGYSQQRLLNVTRTIAQAIALSGANAIEASTALVQLSQGMASTELRGQELRSVLEQLPVVADLIAMGLDVTRGQLLDIAEDGRITADAIIEGVEEGAAEIDRLFAQLLPTIGQSFSILQTRLAEYIYGSNQAIGQNAFFARSIITIADNVHVLIPALLTLATTVIVRALIPAIVSLYTAINAHPIAALVSLIAGAVVLFLSFADDMRISSSGLATVWDVLVSAGQEVASTFGTIRDAIGGTVDAIRELFPIVENLSLLLPEGGFAGLVEGYFRFTGNTGAVRVLDRAEELAQERANLADRIEQADRARNEVGRLREDTVPRAVRAQRTLAQRRLVASERDARRREFLDQFLPIRDDPSFAALSGAEQLGIRFDIETTSSLERQNALYDEIQGNVDAYRVALVDAEQVLLRYPNVSREALDGLIQGFRDAAFPVETFIEDLDEQVRLSGLSAEARQAENAVIQAQERSLVALTTGQEAEIRSKIAATQAGRRQQRVYEALQSPVGQAEQALADLATVQERYGDSLDPARVAFWRREIEDSADPLGTYVRQLSEGTDLLALDTRMRAVSNAIKSAENALNIVLVEGTEEYNRVKDEALRRFDAEDTARRRGNLSYGEIIAQLQEETFLLGFNNQEREIQAQLLNLERQARDGLDSTQRGNVEARLRENAALTRQNQLYEQLRDPVGVLRQRIDDLTTVQERFSDVSERLANEHLADLQFQILALSDAPIDQFRAALVGLGQLGSRVAEDLGRAFTTAFQQASDETARYIVEGEAEFDRVIQNLLSSLISIQIQENFLAPLAQSLSGFFDRRRGAPEDAVGDAAAGVAGDASLATAASALAAAAPALQTGAATLNTGAGVFSGAVTTFSGATPAFAAGAPAFSTGATAFAGSAPTFATAVTSLSTAGPALTNAAAALSAAAAQLAAGSVVNVASGGLIRGPGGPRSDSIAARLSNGEFVVNARATRRHIGLLSHINAKGFAAGGLVGAGGGGGIRINVIDRRTVRPDEPPPQVEASQDGQDIDIVLRDSLQRAVYQGDLDAPMRDVFGVTRNLRT